MGYLALSLLGPRFKIVSGQSDLRPRVKDQFEIILNKNIGAQTASRPQLPAS